MSKSREKQEFQKAEKERNDKNNDEKQIGSYLLGKTIGEGTFGKVKLATHRPTNEKVAIKILDKSKMIEEDDIVHVQKEIAILKKLKHKNIVQLYEIIQTRKHIYLIMDYAEGGELFDYISKKKKLTEIESCKFFQDIINGLEYLHQQQIAHRDLKPENLLLDYKKNLKITDFGLSTIYTKGTLLKTPCGTPSYAPPEMLKGEPYNGTFSDIWSSGIILYAMLVGYLPFSESSSDEIVCTKIIEGNFEIPSSLSSMATDLLKKILRGRPEERITLEQIKQHPWFNLLRTNLCPGIVENYHKVPIDYKILNSLTKFDIDISIAEREIMNNKHNSNTAVYYLTLNKYVREGGKSISDLSSRAFVEYINNPNSLVGYEEEPKVVVKSASCELFKVVKRYKLERRLRYCFTEKKELTEFKERMKNKKPGETVEDSLIVEKSYEIQDSLNLGKFHKMFSERLFTNSTPLEIPYTNLRTKSDCSISNVNVKKILSDISKKQELLASPITVRDSLKNDRTPNILEINFNYSMSMNSFDSKIEEGYKVYSSQREQPSNSLLNDAEILKKSLILEDISIGKKNEVNKTPEKTKIKKVVHKTKEEVRKINIDYSKKIREKNLHVKLNPSQKVKKEEFEKILEEKKKIIEEKKIVNTKDPNFFSNISGTYISEDMNEVSVERKIKPVKDLNKMFLPLKKNRIKLTKVPPIPIQEKKKRNQENNIFPVPRSPPKYNNNSVMSMQDMTNMYKISGSDQFKEFSNTNRVNFSELLLKQNKVKEVFAENKETVHKKIDKLKEEMEKSREKYRKENLSLKSKVTLSTQYTLSKKQSDNTIKKQEEKPNENEFKVSIDTSTKKVVRMQFNYVFNKIKPKPILNLTDIVKGNTNKSNTKNCKNIHTIKSNNSNPIPEKKDVKIDNSKSSFDEIFAHIPKSEKVINIPKDPIPVSLPVFVNYNITIYDGIIDLNCLFSHCADKILETAISFLKKYKIYFVQTQKYKLRCSKNGSTFDIEILIYESFSYVKLKKTQGDFTNYLSMTSQLLKQIKSI